MISEQKSINKIRVFLNGDIYYCDRVDIDRKVGTVTLHDEDFTRPQTFTSIDIHWEMVAAICDSDVILATPPESVIHPPVPIVEPEPVVEEVVVPGLFKQKTKQINFSDLTGR